MAALFGRGKQKSPRVEMAPSEPSQQGKGESLRSPPPAEYRVHKPSSSPRIIDGEAEQGKPGQESNCTAPQKWMTELQGRMRLSARLAHSPPSYHLNADGGSRYATESSVIQTLANPQGLSSSTPRAGGSGGGPQNLSGNAAPSAQEGPTDRVRPQRRHAGKACIPIRVKRTLG
jgi:hypothetical protein